MKSTALALVLLMLACGGEAPEQKSEEQQEQPTDPGATHSHEGFYGGQVVTFGNHEGHLEVKLDHHTWAMTMYVYDQEMNDVAIEDDPVMSFVSENGPTQVVGEGADSMWMFLHDDINDKVVKYRFRFKWNGKTYNAEWAHDHSHDHPPADGEG